MSKPREREACEYMPGGISDLKCGQSTDLLVSYGGGDKIPVCIGHLVLELVSPKDPDFQQQEWTVVKL
ncbi:MAG TPA: hypothetical protein VK667_07400 [Ktedonobacteraceae bacterium]|nr:hypothetical protein [Ktedonobacteraceae bacterium]